MLFAAAGYKVIIYDVDSAQMSSALENILSQLKELEKSGLLRGSLSVVEQHKLISGTSSLADCVVDAKYVQVSKQLKASLLSLMYIYEVSLYKNDKCSLMNLQLVFMNPAISSWSYLDCICNSVTFKH